VTRLGSKPAVPLSWRVLRGAVWRIVRDWRWYLFSALFAVSATSFEKTGVYGEFTFWLQSTGRYSLQQVNYYPSIFTTIAIVSTYVLTIVSTLTGSRAIINPIM
jgi:ACS family pantothenate transporter-like MFS transporter